MPVVNIGGLITLDTLTVTSSAANTRYLPKPQKQWLRPRYATSEPSPAMFVSGHGAGTSGNGFPCYKNGGNTCFSFAGENQFHAIFGGGPSYIVHPSDTAVALLALDAKFRIVGPSGRAHCPGRGLLRSAAAGKNPARENILAADEALAEVQIPVVREGTRSTYHKTMDREAWTHAVVSAAIVLEMDKQVCRSARVVLGGVAPIPWRLPEVEQMLAGQRITDGLAAAAAEHAVAGARPLAKNGYKVPLTRGIVRRTLLELANRA